MKHSRILIVTGLVFIFMITVQIISKGLKKEVRISKPEVSSAVQSDDTSSTVKPEDTSRTIEPKDTPNAVKLGYTSGTVEPRVSSKSSKTKLTDQWKGTNRSLTVVTAFFDLGKFPKGSFSNMRSAETYKRWMEVYKYLRNPLIIYTDSEKYVKYLKKLRAKLNSATRVLTFKRDELWTFQIKNRIAKIYSKPGYPKFYPNTYSPEYTSMTHSKLTLVAKAINSSYFPSDYFCWIDIGYFRDIVGRNRDFYLEVPADFDNTKIGVTRIYNSDLKYKSAKAIILGNMNWIGGGLFLGKPNVMVAFEKQYQSRVMYYLSQGLMNAEQHILYAMFSFPERKKNPISVDVQLYIPGTQSVIGKDKWFYLGYLMYHEVGKSKTATTNKVDRKTKKLWKAAKRHRRLPYDV